MGHAALSERALGELDELLAETGNDEARPRINAGQARLALQRGDRAAVRRWLAAAPAAWADHLSYMECPSVTAARALLARGEPRDAAAALARLAAFRARAEREHVTFWVVQALAVAALAERARGDAGAALDHLAAALERAEPGGFVRSFLDLGPPLAALLRDLAARRPPSPYLARLLAAFDEDRPQVPAPERVIARSPAADPALAPLDQLTAREVQVLAQLAQHLTNKEIAAALAISPQTVKRHVSNLYDKLGVGSRRQAVVQATARNLLPPAPH